jgi:hypothetical protein
MRRKATDLKEGKGEDNHETTGKEDLCAALYVCDL